jgi:hypothetical protein
MTAQDYGLSFPPSWGRFFWGQVRGPALAPIGRYPAAHKPNPHQRLSHARGGAADYRAVARFCLGGSVG